jgi:hypothetical protein
MQGCGPLPSAQVVVIANLRDSAVLHDDGTIAPAPEGTEVRSVNEEPADSKRAGVGLHGRAGSYQELAEALAPGRAELPKKGFGQRTRRNNKYEKRAAARIALT